MEVSVLELPSARCDERGAIEDEKTREGDSPFSSSSPLRSPSASAVASIDPDCSFTLSSPDRRQGSEEAGQRKC